MKDAFSKEQLDKIASIAEDILEPADAKVYIEEDPTVLRVASAGGNKNILKEGDKLLEYTVNISSDYGDHQTSVSPNKIGSLGRAGWSIAHDYHKHADIDIWKQLRKSLFESYNNYLK